MMLTPLDLQVEVATFEQVQILQAVNQYKIGIMLGCAFAHALASGVLVAGLFDWTKLSWE